MDYLTARARFCETAARAGAELFELMIKPKGPHQEDLTINIAAGLHGA